MGVTPTTHTIDAFKNNVLVNKGEVDMQSIAPNDKICCGSVSAEIKYGLSDEFSATKRKTGEFGLSDLGTAGGLFSDKWTHREGWKVIPMQIKKIGGTWSFNYIFAKGDCCGTKKYVEDIKITGVQK